MNIPGTRGNRPHRRRGRTSDTSNAAPSDPGGDGGRPVHTFASYVSRQSATARLLRRRERQPQPAVYVCWCAADAAVRLRVPGASRAVDAAAAIGARFRSNIRAVDAIADSRQRKQPQRKQPVAVVVVAQLEEATSRFAKQLSAPATASSRYFWSPRISATSSFPSSKKPVSLPASSGYAGAERDTAARPAPAIVESRHPTVLGAASAAAASHVSPPRPPPKTRQRQRERERERPVAVEVVERRAALEAAPHSQLPGPGTQYHPVPKAGRRVRKGWFAGLSWRARPP